MPRVKITTQQTVIHQTTVELTDEEHIILKRYNARAVAEDSEANGILNKHMSDNDLKYASPPLLTLGEK